MTHNLQVTPGQFAELFAGKTHLITKHKTTFSQSDKIILQVEGHREEVEAIIKEIDVDEHIFKGYCCLGLRHMQQNDIAVVNLSGALQDGIEALGAQQ